MVGKEKVGWCFDDRWDMANHIFTWRHVLLPIVLAVLLAAPASADTILLKNGATFEGRIVKETKTSITIETADGRITLRRSRIQLIKKAPWRPEAEVKDAAKRREEAAGRSQRTPRKTGVAPSRDQRTATGRNQAAQRGAKRRASPG